MIRKATIFLTLFLLAALAQQSRAAATAVALSLTGNGSAAPGAGGGFNLTLSGSGTASPLGQVTFNGSAPIADIENLTGASPITGKLTLIFSATDTVNVSFSVPAVFFIPDLDQGTGTGSATVTGGTGQYAGATGSFPSLTGSGTATGLTTSSFQVQGNGMIVTPGPTSPVIMKVVDRAAGTTRLAAGVPTEITGTGFGNSAADAATFVIAGKPAPILSFISPADVVVQVPADAPTGQTTVTATYKGIASQPFNITLDAFAPAIFGPAGTGGSAFYSSDGKPVNATNPASANQQVYAIALGLGPTNPAQVTNTIATTKSPTTMPVQVMVGNKLVMPDYAGLFVGGTPGTYQVLFRLPSDVVVGNQSVVISVGGKSSNTATLTVGPPIPGINAIVNGATFRANKSAPNSFVSLFGINFGGQDTPSNVFPATAFNSVSVLVNGPAIPLYFVIGTAGQINVVLPSELPETGTASVQVKNAQGVSAAFQLQMGSTDVGLFRIADPSNAKRNNGAVLFANTAWKVMPTSMATAIGFSNCNGLSTAAACGQPAKVGDVVQIYVTGLGKATPNGNPSGQPLPTGSLAPNDGNPLYKTVQTPTVTIGGNPAQVSFSGIAPGNAGLYQINVEIPAGVQSGDDVPVVVTMPGGSTDTVTIAIRPS